MDQLTGDTWSRIYLYIMPCSHSSEIKTSVMLFVFQSMSNCILDFLFFLFISFLFKEFVSIKIYFLSVLFQLNGNHASPYCIPGEVLCMDQQGHSDLSKSITTSTVPSSGY